jgi:uncharacterized protein (DUF433 family)
MEFTIPRSRYTGANDETIVMTTLNPMQVLPLTRLDDGTIMITDTGVPLETVVARHNLGETPMEIHEGYPTIDLVVVHLVIAYYLSHKPECDAYVEQQGQRTEAARARLEARPGAADYLNDLRARAAEFRAAREVDTLAAD